MKRALASLLLAAASGCAALAGFETLRVEGAVDGGIEASTDGTLPDQATPGDAASDGASDTAPLDGSTNPDATPDASADADSGIRECKPYDAGEAGVVVCPDNGTPCPSDEVCCGAPVGNPDLLARCVVPGCGSLLTCDGPEDCPGAVCCATLRGYAPGSGGCDVRVNVTQCAAACAEDLTKSCTRGVSTTERLCHAMCDCPATAICCPVPESAMRYCIDPSAARDGGAGCN